jgi:general transcription factor 3C polypeptide 5 (transcription factor C subunit 1)
MCGPLLSRNSSTDNVLLKITVPKRTGRKRKRGSDEPFMGLPLEQNDEYVNEADRSRIRSRARLDDPAELLRTLKDNVGRYQVEAVAAIEHTHRFRGMQFLLSLVLNLYILIGLADFHQATSNTEFGRKSLHLASGHGKQTRVSLYGIDIYSTIVEELRKFKLNPAIGWKKNEDLIPPPALAIQPLPINWAWHQSRDVKEEIDEIEGPEKLAVIKTPSAPTIFRLEHIAARADTVPGRWRYDMPTDPKVLSLIDDLNIAFEERPIWVRRALVNRLSNHPHCALLISTLHYVGFQFNSGPFRDCIVKYGLDPRINNKYNIYQSMTIQTLHHEKYDAPSKLDVPKSKTDNISTTHLFDGKNISFDGKVWQLCDVTDPILVALIKGAPLREDYHHHDGYFHNGSWAKIRSIMRLKILSILFNVPITEHHITSALAVPDKVMTKQQGNQVTVLFPNFTDAEVEIAERMKGSGVERIKKVHTGTLIRKRKRQDRIMKFGAATGNGRKPHTTKRMRALEEAAKRIAGGDVIIPTVERDDHADDDSKILEYDESDADGTTASEDFEQSGVGFGIGEEVSGDEEGGGEINDDEPIDPEAID